MRVYRLEDKLQDRDFLAGKEVKCRAVFPKADLLANPLKQGDFLLVVLSDGKKYKGKVKAFENISLNDYEVGELIVVRG